jgi:hypothetical protein
MGVQQMVMRLVHRIAGHTGHRELVDAVSAAVPDHRERPLLWFQLIQNGGEPLRLGLEMIGQLLASEAVVAVPGPLVRVELREDGSSSSSMMRILSPYTRRMSRTGARYCTGEKMPGAGAVRRYGSSASMRKFRQDWADSMSCAPRVSRSVTAGW